MAAQRRWGARSKSSTLATAIVGVIFGSVGGLTISYFLQPGLLRMLISYPDYIEWVAKVAIGREPVDEQRRQVYWTAMGSTFAGAAGGYVVARISRSRRDNNADSGESS